MADSFLQVPADGTGKKLDTDLLTVGANSVHRGRNQITGVSASAIAAVVDSEPSGDTYGLAVRAIGPVQPVVDSLSSSALAAGASVDLDGTTIANLSTGKLLRVIVSSSAACKWIIKTRNGGVEVEKGTLYTSGVHGAKPSDQIEYPSGFVSLAGSGVDENFRVTVTNLDYENAADVKATIFWDEAS